LVAPVKLLRYLSAIVRGRRRPPAHVVASGGSVGGGGFYVQGVLGRYGGPSLTLLDFVVLASVMVIAALGVEILRRVLPRARSAFRARRAKRRRVIADAGAERRTRALMSELCPHGWRAQITLFGPGDDLPAGAPRGDRARVALDWAELNAEHDRVAVARRVWAPTIAEALEAMVSDRRTDETLEQIEQGAVGEGEMWPDV
jgi:hypothetical protein